MAAHGYWDRTLLDRIASIGADPMDPPELAIQKRSLAISTTLSSTIACVWVGSYWAMGLIITAAVPLIYQVVSVINLVVFSRTRRFRFFRRWEHSAGLLFPFAMHLSLGGFIPSSGLVIWSFTAPVGAMLFSGRRAGAYWFIAFLLIILLAALLDPLIPNKTDEIPKWVLIMFFSLNITGVSLVCYLQMQYFVRERERVTAELATERERSERLLRNVLPSSIAERLKIGGATIADRTEEVGVLFADIAEFTPLSADMEPESIVKLLDELFFEFDALAELHELEKIKTIGDAYMVASGLLDGRAGHEARLAEMALGMLEVIRVRPPLRVRIGMDFGPVVAGVIGRRRASYDLWGDTVNTAARMESQGVMDAIQVTDRVYHRLKDRYTFEDHGTIEVKGKGPMPTWLLLARK